jgi:hypothetical protein
MKRRFASGIDSVDRVCATAVDQKAEVCDTRDVGGDMVTQRATMLILDRRQVDVARQQAIEHGDALHEAHQVHARQTVDRRTGVEQQSNILLSSLISGDIGEQ